MPEALLDKRQRENKDPQEPAAAEKLLEAVLDMYQIPGQKKITARSFERYLASKKQDRAIAEAVELSGKPIVDKLDQLIYITKDYKQAKDLIESTLKDGASIVQRKAMEFAKSHRIYDTEDEMFDFIRRNLKHENVGVREVAAEMIYHLPLEERLETACELLSGENIASRRAVLENLDYWSYKNNRALLEKILAGGDRPADLANAAFIYENRLASDDRQEVCPQIEKIISDGVRSADSDRQLAALERIHLLSPYNRIDLLRSVLKQANPEVAESASRIARRLKLKDYLDRDIAECAAQFISSDDESIRQAGRRMFENIGNSNVKLLMAEFAEKSSDEKNKLLALQERLHQELANTPPEDISRLIGKIIEFDSYDLNALVLDKLGELSDERRAEFFNQEFAAGNEKVKAALVDWALSVPLYYEQGNFQRFSPELQAALIEPPLYRRFRPESGKFPQAKFDKTGSETTLIGGELKDRAIIRHIIPEHFQAWQRLYEDAALWRDHGFDYVPIEPIISYQLNKEGLVDVYSGVLDLSLAKWCDLGGNFQKDLRKQRNKIISILDSVGVIHGHEHEGNFCLKFFRDDNGQPDFTRQPRLYMIDFDQSKSKINTAEPI